LAAIPIRELQADIKKGLMASTPHHRLQIEVHYTEPSETASPTAMSVYRPEESVQHEEQAAEAVPMSPREGLSQRLLLAAAAEAEISPSEGEFVDDGEFFLRREEPVAPAFSLTPAVEVV